MSTTTGPMLRAIVHGDNATVVGPEGGTETVIASADQDIRQAVVTHAAKIAYELGEPIEMTTSGDRGQHHLVVEPDGTVSAIDESPQPVAASFTDAPLAAEGEGRPKADVKSEPLATPAKSPRKSFIAQDADAASITPSEVRGWLHRVGLVSGPSSAELARRERIRVVSAQWAGPRLIAVVNGKGGVGKTPTTAMLSAVYARQGGGSVLAFDNNDTRGTLGWRTEQASHEATISDLLAAAPHLAELPTSEMAAFIHHQTEDRYDVLRSNPRVLSAEQRLTTSEFDTLVATVTRGYRLVVFDSGNDESADRWLRMVDWAGQLVVPTLASPESAESAALLLEALAARDERSAALARGAVVVITEAEPASKARITQLASTFRELARSVAVIPFDPNLKSGALKFGALRPRTQNAWIEAAAYAAEQF